MEDKRMRIKKEGTNLKDQFSHFRRIIIIGLHIGAIALCNYWAFLIRFDGEVSSQYIQLFLSTLWMVVFVRFSFISLLGLNIGLWRYAGLNDIFGILKAVLGSSMVLYILFAFILKIEGYPRSIYIIDSLLLILMLSGFRMIKRVIREFRPKVFGKGKKVLLIGAGDAGEMVLRDMKKNADLGFQPIGFVDDNLGKKGLRIHGIPVLGTRKDLENLVRLHAVRELIVCIPSATASQMRAIIDECSKTGIPIKTVPGMKDVLDGRVGLSQIRDVSLEDLLAREVIQTDLEVIKTSLKGKRVLVTGAAGSIGSELCRQIADCLPKEIILFDQCENRTYTTLLEVQNKFPKVTFFPMIGDIRDKRSVERIFKLYRPEIVYHAAAYKQVPLMEYNLLESVKNNVLGTMNVVSAAIEYSARRFVLISTDKAVNPTSIMGASKRFAERLVQGIANHSEKTIFTIVRFGNVLGSNGSVVPIFKKQIEEGGPVTVTHPDIKRFFMTIPEAVQLVLQASGMGKGGEIFVLDMGEQIKIMDLARNLISLSGYRPDEDIRIRVTGLRPGEKLYEELFDSLEKIESTEHPRINKAIQMDFLTRAEVFQYVSEFEDLIEHGNQTGIIRLIQKTIPSYKPSSTATRDNGDSNGDRLPGPKHPHRKFPFQSSSLPLS
jgi:FlaA1/EpsC-like NDP-sugar epimerase